jgi:hypothetical protein
LRNPLLNGREVQSGLEISRASLAVAMPVKHIVLFKFKDSATETQIEEIKASLSALDSRKGVRPATALP